MARRRIYPQNDTASTGGEPGHTPLERARIIQTALRLLNESGFKELSMRKIADALGVKTASLYYHVKDKDQLLQLLADTLSDQMAEPDPALPWREQLVQWSGAFLTALRGCRDAPDIFQATIAMGYGRLTQIERLFHILAAAGFRDEHIPWMASILKNYVIGFAADEARLKALTGPEDGGMEQRDGSYTEAYRSLPEDRFPNMIRLAVYTTRPNGDEEFQFGLEALMDGFEAKAGKV
ncbi:TetR/AcrR family transcriptional regulator C-terminal domain-containing protein [Paenibacillus sp. NPDC056579]|uniref:TetR/AcrR family transcriptional regulator C-terminal domain-containing protein n=1 Tax=Paenibacillus sp. NPDC056579 TaxID=3345871 RepID=UPI0036864386